MGLKLSIIESFERLAKDCPTPAALADDFLSQVDGDYQLSDEEWLEVMRAVRAAAGQAYA